MDDLQFRAATAADIDALVALVTSAYRGDASRQGWTTEADMLDGQRIDPEVLRHDIERPHSLVVVAEQDGVLLACAHVAEEDGAGYFGMFSVKPDLQGGGIGKRMTFRDDPRHGRPPGKSRGQSVSPVAGGQKRF